MHDKKIIINRTLLFICAIIAVPLFLLLEFIFKPIINGESISNKFFIEYIVYFTNWSNILGFIWATLAFSNLYIENEKLENILEHPSVKGVPLIMLFITFAVSNTILLIPLFQSHSVVEGIAILFGWWLFFHTLVPIFFVLDFILLKGFKTNRELSIKEISINMGYSIIIPLLWLIPSLFLIGFHVIEPQYPFMNLFGEENALMLVVHFITLIFIALSWFGIFYGISIYSNKKYKEKVEN